MIEGAMKMPEPMTLPTMRVVASSSPSPRTRPSAGAVPAGARGVVLTTASSFSSGSPVGKAVRIGDPPGMSTFLPAQVVAAGLLAAALAGHLLHRGGGAAEL